MFKIAPHLIKPWWSVGWVDRQIANIIDLSTLNNASKIRAKRILIRPFMYVKYILNAFISYPHLFAFFLFTSFFLFCHLFSEACSRRIARNFSFCTQKSKEGKNSFDGQVWKKLKQICVNSDLTVFLLDDCHVVLNIEI